MAEIEVKVPVTVKVGTTQEQIEVHQALQTLYTLAGNKNIIKFADKVKAKPSLISQALRFI